MNTKQSNDEKEYNEAKQKVGQGIDSAFGAGTAHTVAGRTNQAIGYAEMEAGHAAGDREVEFDGVKRAVRGTAQYVAGRTEHDLATLKAQIEKEVAALKAETANLKAEYDSATQSTRADAKAKMETTKAKLQATQQRTRAAIEQVQNDTDEKVTALQQQAAQAKGDAKAKIEDAIAQLRDDNKRYVDTLNKTLEDGMLVISR